MKPRSGQARPKLDPKPGRENDAFSVRGRSPDAAREVAGGTAVETRGGGSGEEGGAKAWAKATLSITGCLLLVEDPWAILGTINRLVLVEDPWDILSIISVWC